MKMRKSRQIRSVAAFAVAVASFSYGGIASAQTAKGPWIELSAQGRYDSNVAGAASNQAALRGLTKADERLVLNANINLAKRLGVFNATLVGFAGYNFYAHNTRLNREHIGLDGTLAANLARCQGTFTGGFHRQQSDLGDIVFITGSPSQNVENVETTANYGVDVGCGGDIGFRPDIGIQRSTGTNSSVFRQFSDFNRLDYTASLRYAQPVLGKLSLIGTIQDVGLPNRPKIGTVTDGYLSKIIGGRFERDIGANLKGAIQVNYNDLRPRRPGVPSFSGITYSADVTATFADRLQLHGVFARSTQPTLRSDAAYSVETSYSLDATFAASRRLSFGLGGSYQKRRYPGAGLILLGPSLTDDNRKQVTANVSFRANDRLRFSLDGLYVARDSAVTIYDYDNTGVGFTTALAL